MLPHLIRRRFLDRTWGSLALGAAAEFWFRLYEAAAPAHGFSTRLSHEIEVRLRGFPRPYADAVRDELARRVARGDCPAPAVDLRDPDTLVFTSGSFRANESPPVGLGLPLLDGPPFDGLFAEVRVRVVGNELRSFRTGTARAVLVLVGELRGGGLILKAVWRSGSSGWEDDLCWKAAWPEQANWLAALKRFRETGQVSEELARKVFVPRRADWAGGLVARLIRIPRDKPRLGGLLARGLLFATLLVGIGIWAAEAVDQAEWVWFFLIGPAAYWVLWLTSAFVRNEARTLFSGYAKFRDRYKRVYGESVQLVAVPRPEAVALLDHPWGRKYTAELMAAGFTDVGEVRSDPPLSGANLSRVFLAPDGVTYLNVLFVMSTHRDPESGFRLWPATVSLLAYTYFPNGGRVASVNGRHSGYRRKRTGPEHLVRVFPGTEDPVEFVRRHAAAVDAFGRETGRSPLRHERFDLYVRRLNDDQQEQRRLYGEHPYTWADHLRWYLRRPWWEYRG